MVDGRARAWGRFYVLVVVFVDTELVFVLFFVGCFSQAQGYEMYPQPGTRSTFYLVAEWSNSLIFWRRLNLSTVSRSTHLGGFGVYIPLWQDIDWASFLFFCCRTSNPSVRSTFR